jgi:hypothetical protein
MDLGAYLGEDLKTGFWAIAEVNLMVLSMNCMTQFQFL